MLIRAVSTVIARAAALAQPSGKAGKSTSGPRILTGGTPRSDVRPE